MQKQQVKTESKTTNSSIGRRLRNWCKLFPSLFILAPLVVASADQLVWDRKPLSVDLKVDGERYLYFPYPVEVGVPSELTEILKVQSVGNTVYLTATQPFERHRLLVRSQDDGTIMILDLKAGKDEVGADEVHIKLAPQATEENSEHPMNLATLTRHAAQSVYAPIRLHPGSKSLVRVSVPKDANRLFRTKLIQATPHLCWRSKNNLYVTAVILENKADDPIELEPSMIRGQWKAATFHHHRLLGSDSERNMTVLYLISDLPFSQALEK